MRELSLFTGAGGGIYGSKLLGWKTLGYVEWEKYPQQIIAQRIKDGIFDNAPIFGDIRAFVSEGYARRYRGMVDIVTGGFPCQPFSVAGKRKASDDERNMWPATMDVVRAVKPKLLFFENVPGLLSASQKFCGCCGQNDWQHRPELCWSENWRGSRCGVCQTAMDDKSNESVYYFGTILRDLAEAGYDARWCVLGADDVGGIHRRKRLWIYATNTNSNGQQQRGFTTRAGDIPEIRNTQTQGKRPKEKMDAPNAIARSGKNFDVANTRSKRGERVKQETLQREQALSWCENIRSVEDLCDRPYIPKPIICGMDDGVANRSNRLKAVGNGQVPLTMATAYAILSSENCK